MSDPSDLATLLPPGAVVAGKYEVMRVLGQGGMGLVLEARHLRMNRGVALKVLLPAFRTQHEVVARFEREARAAAQLRDVHVARVLDVDALEDGSPFMVMELLRGEDLAACLARRGKLPYREAVGYLLEACAGMLDAHRAGVVHRDLKPGNLFIDTAGERPTLKILDFGISKITDDIVASITQTATAFGTPLYMSPEQVRSAKDVDARADIWSLGVVLYELIAGEPPFLAPTATAILAAIIADTPRPLAQRVPEVPAALEGAVTRALAKRPADRFPDVAAFAAALAPFAPDGDAPYFASLLPADPGGPSSAATNLPALTATPRRPARAYAPIAAGMVAAFALGGVLLFTAVRRRPEVAPAAEPSAAASTAVPTSTAAPTVLPAETAATAAPTVSAAPTPTAPHLPSARPTTPPPSAAPTVAPGPTAPRPRPPADDPKYL
jgi:serine/threonine-protein kinase